MKKIIAVLTLLEGLPGLAGIYVLYKLGNLPAGTEFIVVNAIVFRGICGTAGGILLWMGKRWGNYLATLSWSYLIVVSVLTLVSLYDRGLVLSADFISANYASFGKPLVWSLIKLLLGIPIVYLLIRGLLQARMSGKKGARP